MDTDYILFYFNAPKRAEPIRLTFLWAGVEFVDVRLSKEDHKELKALGVFPLNGSLPCLQHFDFRLGQSIAIIQYLSKQLNMWPSNLQDDHFAMSLLGAWDDLKDKSRPYFHANNEEDKAKAAESFWQYATQWQLNISKLLGDKKCFFPAVGITGADITIFDGICLLLKEKPDFPLNENVKNLWDLISSNSKIAKWRSEDQTKKANFDICKLFSHSNHHEHHHHHSDDHENDQSSKGHHCNHQHEQHHHEDHHHQQQEEGDSCSNHSHQQNNEKEALKLKIQMAELELQTMVLQLNESKKKMTATSEL
jgi:hypothetical protein